MTFHVAKMFSRTNSQLYFEFARDHSDRDNLDETHSVKGYENISLAIRNFIFTTRSLRRLSLKKGPSTKPLGTYITEILYFCQAPSIVAYCSLYILVAACRSCNCKCSTPDDHREDDDSDDPPPQPSSRSHRLSQMFTRSPLSRIRKSHWGGYHVFMGAFLAALWAYKGDPDLESISEISGFSEDELAQLQAAFISCTDKNTGEAVYNMINEGEPRKFSEVECPVDTMHRKRLRQLAARHLAERQGYQAIPPHLRQLYSLEEYAELDSLEEEEDPVIDFSTPLYMKMGVVTSSPSRLTLESLEDLMTFSAASSVTSFSIESFC